MSHPSPIGDGKLHRFAGNKAISVSVASNQYISSLSLPQNHKHCSRPAIPVSPSMVLISDVLYCFLKFDGEKGGQIVLLISTFVR